MSTEVKVPTLGESVSEATIGEWLKQPGEAVAADEPIASLETDKVAVEVPAPVAGVMGQHIAKAGDKFFIPLRKELGRQITAWSGARIDVRPAALGDDSVLYGALALAECL